MEFDSYLKLPSCADGYPIRIGQLYYDELGVIRKVIAYYDQNKILTVDEFNAKKFFKFNQLYKKNPKEHYTIIDKGEEGIESFEVGFIQYLSEEYEGIPKNTPLEVLRVDHIVQEAIVLYYDESYNKKSAIVPPHLLSSYKNNDNNDDVCDGSANKWEKFVRDFFDEYGKDIDTSDELVSSLAEYFYLRGL